MPRPRKGGKYSAVLSGLPKLPTVDPSRQTIVDAVRAKILEPPGADDLSPELRTAAQDSVDDLLDTIDGCFKRLNRIELRATAGRRWASEYARVYAELRKIHDRVEAWGKEINLILEAYISLMVEQLEVEGVTSLKMSNGQPVSTWLEPYAQVTDKEKLRIWCLEQGLDRSLALPWQTLNNLTKAMLLRGDEEPPGVTIFAKTKIRLGAGGGEDD